MRPIRPFTLVALLALGLGTLALGWREGRRHERPDAGRPPLHVVVRDSRALIEEAIRLYAAGQFPRACERFSRAADDNPASAALRVDVGSCFEGWGWQALREGRPDEALLLFRQGLADAPESTTLLKGLGLAAVHAGRPDDAFVPLERAVRAEFDPEVRVLLAHLYDSRDDPARAIAHLRAVLEREPDNAGALRLLEKVERERRAESGFHRDVTPRFVLKYRGAPGTEARRTILGLLEVAAERVDRALRWEPRERLPVVVYERGQLQDVRRWPRTPIPCARGRATTWPSGPYATCSTAAVRRRCASCWSGWPRATPSTTRRSACTGCAWPRSNRSGTASWAASVFHKLLIANRGEIALRIIRTCRELGIRTVVAHSKADSDSLPRRLADESICVGPDAARLSYLNIPAIISAAAVTDSEAIHPGYGFLAENAAFAEVCRACSITFVGPSPEAIRLMGDKAQARQLAKQAGVPVVPGSELPLKDAAEAVEVADRIGYPIIFKAAAGGGGRGMRIVRRREDVAQAFDACQSEAGSAFGSAEIYCEKYVEGARHVEVQVLGDNNGIRIHLGERECSVQRRHQKLLEESPAPNLGAETRSGLHRAALTVAAAVNYVSAGTVEFIVDAEERHC